MKYVALLRAINVGGNGIVKMAELKVAVEKSGFQNVSTYINSGNVLFESEEKDTDKITAILEKDLEETFHFSIPCVVLSYPELKKVLSEVPEAWKKTDDMRCYIAFLRKPLTPAEAIKEIEAKEGIDFITAGPKVVYMATLLSGLTKSNISKVIQKKIYKFMTMRNYNTSKKVLGLMEKS
jgi:uncharacterized protein (DUF1697 family)